MEKLDPIHPGEILLEEFLNPMKLRQNHLAKQLHISEKIINEIADGKRSISADTALRLSHYFGNSAKFWLGLQMDYDLEITKDEIENSLDIEPYTS